MYRKTRSGGNTDWETRGSRIRKSIAMHRLREWYLERGALGSAQHVESK